jgi:hypothetical protein
VGRLGLLLLMVILVSAPWMLFFDPIAFPRRAHIPRDPAAIYRLYSDDFASVAASRTLPRTLANLFVPHNTHIVPAWRVLTWALVAWSGSLVKLPEVLPEAAYGILGMTLAEGKASRPRPARSDQYGLPASIGGSARVERFSNRVRFLMKVSLTLPVGPLRFLATMTSARPGWSLGS